MDGPVTALFTRAAPTGRRVAVVGAPGWHLTKMEDRAERAPKPSTETLARATAWQGPKGDAA